MGLSKNTECNILLPMNMPTVNNHNVGIMRSVQNPLSLYEIRFGYERDSSFVDNHEGYIEEDLERAGSVNHP